MLRPVKVSVIKANFFAWSLSVLLFSEVSPYFEVLAGVGRFVVTVGVCLVGGIWWMLSCGPKGSRLSFAAFGSMAM